MTVSRPAVLVAALVAAAIGVGSAALGRAFVYAGVDSMIRSAVSPTLLQWPFGRSGAALFGMSFLGGFVVLVGMVVLTTWLGARSARPGGGFFAVLFSSWLGMVLGATVAGIFNAISLLAITAGTIPAGQYFIGTVSYAPYGGLIYGWIVGLIAALVFRATNAKTPYEATGPSGPPTSYGVSPFNS
ncbi:MAG TPA: hypothetical protein VIP98_23815 [Microlunatus sp.]